MKAILEFDLDDSDDKEHHDLAVRATEVWVTLWRIDKHCRGALKHGHEYESADEALEAIREMIEPDLLNLLS